MIKWYDPREYILPYIEYVWLLEDYDDTPHPGYYYDFPGLPHEPPFWGQFESYLEFNGKRQQFIYTSENKFAGLRRWAVRETGLYVWNEGEVRITSECLWEKDDERN